MISRRFLKFAIVLIGISVVLCTYPTLFHSPKTNNVFKSANENPTDIEEKPTYAVIYPLAHPFFEKVTKNARNTAESLGVNLIIRAPGTSSVEEQVRIFNQLIKEDVDGIAIGPTDPGVLTPLIDKAMDLGINVICFDTDAPKSKRLSYIGTDNLAAGKHLGDTVAKLLNQKGKVIVSSGLSTMDNLNTRIEGLKGSFRNYPDMEIMEISYSNGTPANTLKNIEKMVASHPDFDALVGIDSLSGPAAITVWKAQGIKKTSVTFDDLPIILEGVTNHHVTSAISQNQGAWGHLIVERLNQANYGQTIPKIEITKTVEITADTIDTHLSPH
ncbi:substrate-binding domain-containing protein [Aquibacillus kalidii]|uniref:substrate-binding domain-containing protein n=1 Tax=Aquibacillus kalidii TaxID=2762597 RepID=UPI00164757EE|nr:substrate-binding domain-containing protein [Aquibacillus kalidii]